MKDNKGFVELSTINDYCGKLKYDYNQFKLDGDNVYIAFNFFLTAYHLIDWLFEGKYNDKDRERINKEPIIRICSNIANGIKHFETDKKRHNSIKEIEREKCVEDGYVEQGYFDEPIMIRLDDTLERQFGKEIPIIELADRVMDFWRVELEKREINIDL